MPATKSQLISRPKKSINGRGTLTRESWILAARKALIASGIDGVKVDLLGRALGVTRGSFYWHFEDRAALLRALLKHWEETNTEPMLDAIARAGARGMREDFDSHIGKLWIDEKEFSPAFDSTMRDWARVDRLVAAAVHRIDERRIAAFQTMFEAYGYKGDAALVRARITYFHQVGYYTLAIKESSEQRARLSTLYDEVLLH